MKPRIRRRFGIWYCAIPFDAPFWGWLLFGSPMGHGYTPAEAYADWKAQQ